MDVVVSSRLGDAENMVILCPCRHSNDWLDAMDRLRLSDVFFLFGHNRRKLEIKIIVVLCAVRWLTKHNG